jgi:hypothetical protein
MRAIKPAATLFTARCNDVPKEFAETVRAD